MDMIVSPVANAESSEITSAEQANELIRPLTAQELSFAGGGLLAVAFV